MQDIGHYRDRIDHIDEQILTLLNERARAAQEIGAIKQQLRMPVLDSQREKSILARLTANNRGPMKNEHISTIFTAIISGCRELE